MRCRRALLAGLVFVAIHAAPAGAQQFPQWTGVVADEARPAALSATPANNQIVSRSLSADGRFVVFSSESATLVAGDTNNVSDIFLRDRQTGLVSRVSVASDGSEANGFSTAATISGNGRHIAFHSCATNLDPPDTDNPCDFFIHDRELGTTVRANVGPNGEQAVAYVEHFNLSADGRYFVFNSGFTPGSFERQVWLRDRDFDGNGIFDEPGTPTTTQISQDTVGPFTGLFDFLDVAISPDGRYISYNAWAFGPDGTGGKWLFLHDRVATTTVRVDLPQPGRVDGNWTSYSADFSDAGHLVYVSNGNNITNTEADFWFSDDVIVYDIATGVNTGVQLTHPGAPAVEYEWAPAISADGRFVAFNGVTWDSDPTENVYVVDRQSGLSYDVSVRPDGTRDNDAAGRPSISADGSAIAFVANAAMLVNGAGDAGVFVVTGVALSPPPASPPIITVSGNGGTLTLDVMVPAGVAWALALEPPSGAGELSVNAGVGPATVDVTVYPHVDPATRELSVILGSEEVRLRQDPAPFIAWVNPPSGPPSGGTSIEVIGYGFVPGSTLTIGGIAATDVTVVDSELITAVTPPNPLGVQRVRVTNPNGDFYEYYFIYQDSTPPVVTHEIAGTLGQNGWYISDVTVYWTYEDPESTVIVNSCPNPYMGTIDRYDAATCSVFSNGGDTFEFVQLNRDTVPPTLNIFPSEPDTYFQGEVVPIAHHCEDATSGIASCTASQTGMQLDTSTVGTFTFTATAVDFAGHAVTKSTNYTVKLKPVVALPEAAGVYNGSATLRATVTAFGSGAPIAGKTVTFFIAYVGVGTAVTSATGEAVLTVPVGSHGAGNHPIHVAFSGDDATLPFEVHGSLAIAKATPTVTWATPAFITHGVPLGSTQLNATASVPGGFAYEPGYWTVLAPGTHTLSVLFTPSDSANYTTASKTVTLKVKARPVITWPAPAPITYPDSITARELSATADVAGTFVYNPPWGTRLDAGTHTLYVTFTPSNTADYVSESATTTVEVLKGTATITWPYFDPIQYPTPLSGLQLNAFAGGDGSLTYSPPLGTVLNAGTHTLTATFTPSYPYNYHPATATREILVGKAYPPVWWQGDLKPIVYGTPLSGAQLYGSSTLPGTITYNHAAGTVLDAGLYIIRLTFTPEDTTNYHTVTHSKYLTVEKKIPVITWDDPASIVYGTPLSATQLNAAASVPGTLSYNPPLGAVVAAGTRLLSVSFTPADSVNYHNTTESVTIVVEKRTPVITWSNPAPIVYGTALTSTQLNATMDVSSGTLVYNPPSGTVLSAGAGQTLTVTYSAALGQFNNYNPASATVTIDVLQLTPQISWTPTTGITYGTPLGASQLNATSNLPGSFAYSPGAGTILPAGTNVVTATFTPTDTANHAAAVQTRQIVVNQAVPVLSWAAPAPITYGTPLSPAQLNATADVPGAFTYSPPPGTILDAGEHSITAAFTPDDPANYAPRSTTRTINILPAAAVVTWPAPQPIVYGTPLSEAQLNATANVAGTFTYSHAPGLVLPAGAHTITVLFQPESANYYGRNAQVDLVVEKAVPVVTWATPAPITYGTALIAAINATANVSGTFTYSPPAGTVLSAGTHQLTATFTPSNPSYVDAVAHVSLEVTRAAPVITWSSPKFIVHGTPLTAAQLDATANVPGSFVYSPAAGAVLNAGTQQLSLTFTPDDLANYTTATAQASIVVGKAHPQITWAAPAAITYGTALSAVQLNAAASVPGSFSYSPAAGTVLSAGTHLLTVNFLPDDSANYFAAATTVSIEVTRAAPVVTWPDPAGIAYGTALSATQLNASANVGGYFTYSPPAGTVLAAGTHALTATFTPNDWQNYAPATANVSIAVAKAAPVITWANPATVTYGTGLSGTQLNATANVSGSFTYSPAAGVVLSAGTHELSMTFIPADSANYTSASRSVSIVITPAALTVRADNASKVYGQSLPAFTATATGLVNGDSMGSLTGALSLNTAATATSAPGTYAVTPNGVSSPNYSITFAAGTLTVAKAETSLTLTTTPNPSQNNQTVQIRAVVAAVAPGAGIANGTVEFRDNGTLLGSATLVNGVATMNKNFKKGTRPLTATFAGDGNFTGSSGAVTHRVP